jgi:plastocyanin
VQSKIALAPGHLILRCTGALILVAFCATCEKSGSRSGKGGTDDNTLVLSKDTVKLDPGVKLVQVLVHTSTTNIEFSPGTVRARTGDIVKFVSADATNHAVGFETDSLAPPARAWIEQTQQVRGPPLISRGAAWVISLKGAPPGNYPFKCLTHDGHGVLVVGG